MHECVAPHIREKTEDKQWGSIIKSMSVRETWTIVSFARGVHEVRQFLSCTNVGAGCREAMTSLLHVKSRVQCCTLRKENSVGWNYYYTIKYIFSRKLRAIKRRILRRGGIVLKKQQDHFQGIILLFFLRSMKFSSIQENSFYYLVNVNQSGVYSR